MAGPAGKLPLQALPAWSAINDIDLIDVRVEDIPNKGLGLVAERELSVAEDTFDIPSLIKIPRGLVLCAESVEEYAKVDHKFKELLDVAGHQSTRGDIMLFLMAQRALSTRTSSDHAKGGVSTPWTEYVQFLSDDVPLPTLWNEFERALLRGTSLEAALEAKLSTLSSEFEALREQSAALSFWDNLFWDSGVVSLVDWIIVDSWYRSRCLELPRSGHSMVPVLDMVNHSTNPTAYYEENGKDDVVLLIGRDQTVAAGDEITISYGSEKSAAEMLFSYGFIDMTSAVRKLTLPLEPLDDDPLAKAKKYIFKEAPSVEFSQVDGRAAWKSAFAYLMCLNEEDGLGFRLVQEIGGDQQLELYWMEEDVTSQANMFETLVQKHPQSDVFRLRVVAVLEDLVATQIARIGSPVSSEEVASLTSRDVFRPGNVIAATSLRNTELKILESVLGVLEQEKAELLANETVIAYLGSMEDGPIEEVAETSNEEADFS